MLPTLLLASALTSSTTGPIATRLPFAETAANALSTRALQHHEALRIDRDFGKPEFDLVVDAWSETARGELADVRLWWVKTTAEDRRSPLSAKSERYVDIDVRRAGRDAMRMRIRGGGREFAFQVELGDDGRAHVFANVVTKDGATVNHCLTTSGRLTAKRVLGIPIGLGALQVSCIADDGRTVRGRVTVRKVR